MEPKDLIQALENSYRDFLNVATELSNLQNQNISVHPITNNQCKKTLQLIIEIQDEIFLLRLKKIIALENPYLPMLRIDKIKQRIVKVDLTYEQMIDIFKRLRQELLAFLTSLPAEKWSRTGLHETEGHITFKEIVLRMIKKEQEIISVLHQGCNSEDAVSQD